MARLVFAAAAARSLAVAEPRVGQEGKDAPWIPTPEEMVRKMLDVAQLAPGERLVDLGSGDGRIVIAASKRGAIARGIEYNPEMVEYSRRLAREARVDVEFIQGDLFEVDFADADVVTMYLFDALNERLRPRLLAMKPGTRVLSFHFPMGPWQPDGYIEHDSRMAYFWRVPARVEGEWETRIGSASGPRLHLAQFYQNLEGRSQWGARAATLQQATLKGPAVSFVAQDAAGVLHRFEATVDHTGPMMGTVTLVNGGAAKLFVATRR